jgi:hypothetical protein
MIAAVSRPRGIVGVNLAIVVAIISVSGRDWVNVDKRTLGRVRGHCVLMSFLLGRCVRLKRTR